MRTCRSNFTTIRDFINNRRYGFTLTHRGAVSNFRFGGESFGKSGGAIKVTFGFFDGGDLSNVSVRLK